MNALNVILRPLTISEQLFLSESDGRTIIAKAENVFKAYISSDFKNWGLNKESKVTPRTEVKIYEMAKDATFKDIFTSLSDDLDVLCLTQHQIINFCVKYPERLRQDGYGTFFLLKKRRLFRRDKFFVVRVRVDSDGLRVDVLHFDDAGVWGADYRHCVVVPKLS